MEAAPEAAFVAPSAGPNAEEPESEAEPADVVDPAEVSLCSAWPSLLMYGSEYVCSVLALKLRAATGEQLSCGCLATDVVVHSY